MSSRLTHINSSSVASVPSLSHAVKDDSYVFVSGQVGIPHGGSGAPAQLADEINNALDSLEMVLKEAGLCLASVVRTNCYLGNIQDMEVFNKIYMQRFPHPRPARTTIQAQLVGELRFEIDAIALIER